MDFSQQNLVAVAIGNTRTRVGLFKGKELTDPSSILTSDPTAVASAVGKLLENVHDAVIVISSVTPEAANTIERKLNALDTAADVYRIGKDLTIPLDHALDDASTLGQDRALCALAAYGKAGQACVVIDAGTAITIDFVDGEGTFQGGAILPGLNMMLTALNQHTAALPKIDWSKPDPARGEFGKDTRHAMILGTRAAAIGAARYLIERYATAYDAYPQIIATGGDAPALFEDDEIIEHIVPDLQLVGIYETCKRIVADGDTEEFRPESRTGPGGFSEEKAADDSDDDL
jgi:type III pantothenate kinase